MFLWLQWIVCGGVLSFIPLPALPVRLRRFFCSEMFWLISLNGDNMLPEELSTRKHDGKNCFKFGSLKKKRKFEAFSPISVLILTPRWWWTRSKNWTTCKFYHSENLYAACFTLKGWVGAEAQHRPLNQSHQMTVLQPKHGWLLATSSSCCL